MQCRKQLDMPSTGVPRRGAVAAMPTEQCRLSASAFCRRIGSHAAARVRGRAAHFRQKQSAFKKVHKPAPPPGKGASVYTSIGDPRAADLVENAHDSTGSLIGPRGEFHSQDAITQSVIRKVIPIVVPGAPIRKQISKIQRAFIMYPLLQFQMIQVAYDVVPNEGCR